MIGERINLSGSTEEVATEIERASQKLKGKFDGDLERAAQLMKALLVGETWIDNRYKPQGLCVPEATHLISTSPWADGRVGTIPETNSIFL